MKISELSEKNLTEEFVGRLLFDGLDYRGEQGSIIMVLGSRKAWEYRVPYAAEIFPESGAQKMLFSGGAVQDSPFGCLPEYKSMLMAAEKLGVDGRIVLTEKRSVSTAENFAFSREILDSELHGNGRVIVVTAAYHMRRALLLAEKILPEYEFIAAPTDLGHTTKLGWALTEKGRRTAYDECLKLKYYAQKGMIENIEI